MRQRSALTRQSFQLLTLGLAVGMPLSVMAQDRLVSQLSPTASLPFELRQVASRYPVTLYGQKGCEGCDAGRQYLQQRGIPFNEKLVNDGDGEALERATGSKQLPALMIGKEVLRGFSSSQWSSYLDAAGYPKQSRLPPNYAAPGPTPLALEPAVAPTPPAVAPPPPAVAAPPAPSGIRF
ncbi:MAG: glutaredoxin family protein [Ideonella sp.]